MSEYTHVEKPFLDQLKALGWAVIDQAVGSKTDIPEDPAASLRSSFREVALKGVFFEAIRAINLTEDGKPWLTDKQLGALLDEVYHRAPRNLAEANESILGLLFQAHADVNEVTGEEHPRVKLIDFHHPEANAFHAINQFRIDTPGRVKEMIIPDIVLFVNGLPIGVVECKRVSKTEANPLNEAFQQLMRYSDQREDTRLAGLHEGEPKLFWTNQLLIRTIGEEAEFGTITATDEEFWYPWRSIFPEQYREYDPPLGKKRAQEVLIQGMLPKETLLDLIRTCSVFMDAGNKRVKVLARHQQYRAMVKIIERLREGSTPEERSGVIWHTQGSGKSLTMVFVIRKLRMLEDLKDYKVCLVCDRTDLEDQLTRTAELSGEKVTTIESSEMMKQKLATDASNLNMVMVHKFQGERFDDVPDYLDEALTIPRFERIGVVNESSRILLMIDEAHRSHGSDLGDNLVEAFPNATRLAFTGTPLIKVKDGQQREHKTVSTFGTYIDKYMLLDAVADRATVRIVYEGKTHDAAVDRKHEFDTKVDAEARRIVESQMRRAANLAKLRKISGKEHKPLDDLIQEHTELEILKLKQKWGTTGDLLEADARIEEIARDMVNHYIDEILPNGFKAQVVASSQKAAVKYRRFIEAAIEERLAYEYAKPVWKGDPQDMTEEDFEAHRNDELIAKIEFLKVVVVISGMGTNELAEITIERKRAREMDAVKSFKARFDYKKPLTGVAFLVVVDMLMTGFDAPVEQVMYIDKKVKNHNLLQTIARVNRVAKGKSRGFIVDYIGLANHLSDALSIYAQEDADEVEKGLRDVSDEIPILQTRYQRLLNLFTELKVDRIKDFVEQKKMTTAEEYLILDDAVTKMEDLKQRANFEVYLKKFLTSLDVVLPNPSGNPYKIPAKRFGVIMAHVRQRYKDETLTISGVGGKVKKLIDEHLISLGINPKIPPVELLSDKFIKELDKHSSKSPRAKASEMEHAIRKHAKVHFNEDPAFYKKISEKLEDAIKKYKDDWDKLFAELFSIRQEAAEGRKDAVEGLGRKAQPFYANIASIAYEGTQMPPEDDPEVKRITAEVVILLAERINIINFWNNTDAVRQLRASISEILLGSEVDAIADKTPKLVTEITNLAKHRHKDLLS
ncbi:HsdR family type I site-specific deoxyribonuclease [bacterium]|nr:HsdR family type I site-specific deoxyribonuclease [bacterium]